MTSLRPDNREVNPDQSQQDSNESVEREVEPQKVSEEAIQVNKVTFEPKDSVEQKEDYKQAEEIERAFVAAMDATSDQSKGGFQPPNTSEQSDSSESASEENDGENQENLDNEEEKQKLQNDAANQNRQFTLVSNIMKVKHDVAKAAIKNVR